MTPETENIPEWARRERQADLDWIDENLAVFWTAATLEFEDAGRGAIVVDTTIQPLPDAGNPFGYFSQEQVEELANEDTKRMVKEYDPTHDFVLVLLKSGDRTSTYRIYAVPPEHQGTVTSEEAPGHISDPPNLETLMQWDAEGGCESACPHHCWTEPDGTCPHGNPSWLLKLGLI